MTAAAPYRVVVFDGRPELRSIIAENLGLAAIQISLVQTYADLGDDRGLEYALRRFAAYAKLAFATFEDLKHEPVETAEAGQ